MNTNGASRILAFPKPTIYHRFPCLRHTALACVPISVCSFCVCVCVCVCVRESVCVCVYVRVRLPDRLLFPLPRVRASGFVHGLLSESLSSLAYCPYWFFFQSPPPHPTNTTRTPDAYRQTHNFCKRTGHIWWMIIMLGVSTTYPGKGTTCLTRNIKATRAMGLHLFLLLTQNVLMVYTYTTGKYKKKKKQTKHARSSTHTHKKKKKKEKEKNLKKQKTPKNKTRKMKPWKKKINENKNFSHVFFNF